MFTMFEVLIHKLEDILAQESTKKKKKKDTAILQNKWTLQKPQCPKKQKPTKPQKCQGNCPTLKETKNLNNSMQYMILNQILDVIKNFKTTVRGIIENLRKQEYGVYNKLYCINFKFMEYDNSIVLL